MLVLAEGGIRDVGPVAAVGDVGVLGAGQHLAAAQHRVAVARLRGPERQLQLRGLPRRFGRLVRPRLVRRAAGRFGAGAVVLQKEN